MSTHKRISEKQVNKARTLISNKIPLSKFFRDKGVFNAEEGKGKVCCPIHEEDTPSMFYDDEKKTCKCFGCSKGGTIVEVQLHLMRKEDESYSQVRAIYDIARQYSIELPNLYEEEIVESSATKYKPSKRERGTVSDEVYKEKILTSVESLKHLKPQYRKEAFMLIDEMYLGNKPYREVYQGIQRQITQSRNDYLNERNRDLL